ncbi:MAG: fibrobacter succinogenes major paralogous domain-containing protein, partial [Dysgonamonadaceae bacterium]|jgi:uncharacterized protein (TIGR02145 family)|nr:fibrobacter succinogenes major paralogous domain-containing protein [Dysgonamonadaceae bacterium]
MFDPGYAAEENAKHVGLMVYHVLGCPVPNPSGIYVWNGSVWKPLVEPEPNLMTDCRDGETYLTGNFGTAGIWMLENLRYIPKDGDGYSDYTHSGAGSDTAKRYAYPGTDMTTYGIGSAKIGWDKSWGVLYNWAGATNGRSSSNDEGNKAYDGTYTQEQGICPVGWHLPSDKEWSDLEQVIGEDAGILYSTAGEIDWQNGWRSVVNDYRGRHGRKMKSTDVGGTSKSAAAGGFNVLLVGQVYADSRAQFGTDACFWSNSFYTALNAWARSLSYSEDGVSRSHGNRSRQFSVRCKKD